MAAKRPQVSPKARKLNRALLQAAEAGDSTQVRELLAQGADIETRDEDGWTPLMLALAAYERYTAALLVELGAPTHATTPDG